MNLLEHYIEKVYREKDVTKKFRNHLKNVIEFIDSIRRDEYIDNIEYVIDMMNALQAMRFAAHQYKQHCERACLCLSD